VTIMRKLVAVLAPVAALVLLASAAPAQARGTDRMWVPDNQLAPFRAVAAQFTVAGANPNYGAITDNAGISCIADPAGSGAMGIHYLNGSILFDGVIDPSQPEAVVYAPSPDGGLHLVALEYIVDKAAWDATHSSAPELFAGHPFDETGSPNRFDLDPFYSQHVWVGRGNPAGNLAMWNPSVHC
jgi:hypothetical protein